MRTTVGQLLVNELLPEELRDYRRVLDKQGLKALLRQIYEHNPRQYNDIVHRLSRLGALASYRSGHTVSLDALRAPPAKRGIINKMTKAVGKVLKDPMLSDDERREHVATTVAPFLDELKEAVAADGIDKGNPFSLQVSSGSRGNLGGLNSLRGADMLYVDSKDRVIPIPVTHSYSEGLDPAEYWAGSYGARRGLIDVKMSVAKAGFFGKQVSQAAHRMVVTENDCDTSNGVPVTANDPDNVGALLAEGSGDYQRNDALTARNIRKLGNKNILIRSPITCQARSGVCAKCSGMRERGKLPEIGDHVGISAVQSLSERLAQGSLSSKHSGGVVGAAPSVSGFELVNQLVQVPKMFKGGAAVSELDGRVSSIEDAPQGGKYVHVGDQKHYILPELNPTVKVGDTVEAGDVISEGIPNPAKIVRHKGVGEGRWYFTKQFTKAFRDSGMPANRRNVEYLARGLINHVRLMDEDTGGGVPGDLMEYDAMSKDYTPRVGFRIAAPNLSRGKYLERPTLHYSIGTRLTPTVIKSLQARGVDKVVTHDDEPGFQPEMHRAMENLTTTEDWQTRLSGFYLGKGFQQAVQRGATSTTEGISFVPRVAQGKPLFGAGKTVKISPVL